MSEKPFIWPKESGTLTADVLREYATWLFPKLELEWESPGVIKRDVPKPKGKPYTFRKSKGWLNVQRDLRPFAAHVVAKLKKWNDRQPFTPERTTGMALVTDLKAFADHVDRLLAKKKAEQSKEN